MKEKKLKQCKTVSNENGITNIEQYNEQSNIF